ncbi:MAG TPA: tetratricopeptide repeat protein [Streptosporangiaceae bacterium]|nr:tetratricopeptide repeat protein [Streptosporangiaceae bacterium]
MRGPDPGASCLVLIGASKYEDENLPDLPAVTETINAVQGAFTDPGSGVIDEANCVPLAGQSNLGQIGRQLRAAASKAKGLLLVYYIGHGMATGRRNDLYLALPDTAWEAPEFSALEYDKVRSAVLDSPAATKMIILDCCYSGRALADTMADPATELISQSEVKGSYVLASAPRDKVSLILPGEERTAFSGRLVDLLRDGLPGSAEFLTADAIYRQLRSQMKAEGLPEPQQRSSATAGELVLARNRAHPTFAGPRLSFAQRRGRAVRQGERGDWAGARDALREIVAEAERALGPESTDTLAARQELARTTAAAGDPQAGATQLRQILADQIRLLGTDHVDTLRTRQYLAVSLGEAGQHDEAVAILRLLLPDRRRVLGGDDSHTLRTAHMLARNLAALGALAEAEAILKEVVTARQRVLGGDHPHTVRALKDLASLQEAHRRKGDG